MKKCYKCNVEVKKTITTMDSIKLKCLKCPKCGEEYFTSSELMRYDVLSGRRKNVRKFGKLGDSAIIRIPNKVMKDFKIKSGDYGFFEERPEGILIRPMSASKLKKS